MSSPKITTNVRFLAVPGRIFGDGLVVLRQRQSAPRSTSLEQHEPCPGVPEGEQVDGLGAAEAALTGRGPPVVAAA